MLQSRPSNYTAIGKLKLCFYNDFRAFGVNPGPIEPKTLQETPQKNLKHTSFEHLLAPDSGRKKLFGENSNSKPPTPSDSFGFPGSQHSSA